MNRKERRSTRGATQVGRWRNHNPFGLLDGLPYSSPECQLLVDQIARSDFAGPFGDTPPARRTRARGGHLRTEGPA